MTQGACFRVVLALCLTAAGWAQTSSAPAKFEGSSYLFVWTGDGNRKSVDFLSIIDANPSSASYGTVVATALTEYAGTKPHHTEYEFPEDNLLFANGWIAGRTFIFDLNDPLRPRVAAQFKDSDGYSFPHSFVRIPNGDRLGTFQSHGGGYGPGGGLVEVDSSGNVARSSSAVDSAVDKNLIWPYSLALSLDADRVVTTSTPMGWPDWAKLPPGSVAASQIADQLTSQVQIWRYSDLHLLQTITLPTDAQKHDLYPAEPRFLADGSVYVNTFHCGLYRLKDVKGARPSAQLVYSFPGGTSDETMCAVPVIVGHYWIQTVGALPGVMVLDISHPEKPVEVSELKIDPSFMMPHWLAADRKSDRLVLTGDDQKWLLVLRFDAQKGIATIDETFREPGAKQPGFNFDRRTWPHGNSGPAVVHGAVFGPA
jgi:hypothetical protein